MKLREIRKSKGVTITALAEAAGVAQVTIWRLETGRRSGTVDVLRRLAAALEVPLEQLFDDAA
jgi:transcriptional regulator with XRE-family HTH domain